MTYRESTMQKRSLLFVLPTYTKPAVTLKRDVYIYVYDHPKRVQNNTTNIKKNGNSKNKKQ